MKKLLLCAVCLAWLPLAAHLPVSVDTEESTGAISGFSFTPLQLGLGFIPYAQLFDGKTHVLAAVGILGLMQDSGAVSAAPVNMLNCNYLLQAGYLLNTCERNFFLSLSLANLGQKNFGLQLGAVNFSSCEYGIQLGAVNQGGMIQIGLCNSDSKFQLGLFNQEGDFQIGLLNYNPDAWIPWMPLFNFSAR